MLRLSHSKQNFEERRQTMQRGIQPIQEQSSESSGSGGRQCTVCGLKNHTENICKFRSYRCKKCNRKGHLQRMCTQKSNNSSDFNYINNTDLSLYHFQFNCDNTEPIKVRVLLNGVPLAMEFDTGASKSAISLSTYREYFDMHAIKNTNAILTTYDGSKIKPYGVCVMPVTYNNSCKNLEIMVVEKGGPPLLGRNFIKVFNIHRFHAFTFLV